MKFSNRRRWRFNTISLVLTVFCLAVSLILRHCSVKVKKIVCVILAPDLEKISSEGGLDSTTTTILGKKTSTTLEISVFRSELN